jgi:hypothetical protein
MAEQIDFQGADVKIRHPWGVWALGIITLGIYHLVWWYKINRELRDYSAVAGQPLQNNPTVSVLALFPGSFIIVPPFWSIVTTSARVRQVRQMVDGTPSSDPNGLLAAVLSLVLGLQTVYIAYAINSCWRSARERAGQGALPAVAA